MSTYTAPAVSSIVKGTVSRIEPYGAFIAIDQTRLRGLLHISQLSSYKVDSVEDCLSLDDEIYVKVLQCDELDDVSSSGDLDNRNNNRRKRYRISLSLKYASQDGTYTDLDPTNEQYERESRGKRNNASSHDELSRMSSNRNNNAPSQLETSLNSQIGMGIAIDPLAAMQQATNKNNSNTNRLVLRNNPNENQNDNDPNASISGNSNKVLFNGYALVDDYEGEVDHVLPKQKTNSNMGNNNDDGVAPPKRPLGRGRGTTLPAWMTSKDDPLGTNQEKGDDHDDNSRNGKRKKKRKKEEKKNRKRKKHHRHRDNDSDDNGTDDHDQEEDSYHRRRRRSSNSGRKRHKKHKSKRHYRSRSRSSSRDSYDDNDGTSKHHSSKRHDESSSDDDKNSKKRRKKRIRHEDKDTVSDEPMFRNVEEAEALIAKLEHEKGE